jgi:hypothetical protein
MGGTGNLPVPVGNLPTGSTMVTIPSGQSHHALPAVLEVQIVRTGAFMKSGISKKAPYSNELPRISLILKANWNYSERGAPHAS